MNRLMYLVRAEKAVDDYLRVQRRIDAIEQDARDRQDGHEPSAKLLLKGDTAYGERYRDLCQDRDRYMAVAQLFATMALNYKGT